MGKTAIYVPPSQAALIAAKLIIDEIPFEAKFHESCHGDVSIIVDVDHGRILVNLLQWPLEAKDSDTQQFVVVNVTRGPGWFTEDQLYVMPGEEAHTFSSLPDAAECVADMMDEHSHTPETAQVFQLLPVPIKQVEKAVENTIRGRAQDDWESYRVSWMNWLYYKGGPRFNAFVLKRGLDMDFPVSVIAIIDGEEIEHDACESVAEAMTRYPLAINLIREEEND